MIDMSETLEAMAKALAEVRGHKDVEHLIVCVDTDHPVPVWHFYLKEARAAARAR